MFKDGSCLHINQLMNGSEGWHTNGNDDWIYYPQQTGKVICICLEEVSRFTDNDLLSVNVSMTAATISASLGMYLL